MKQKHLNYISVFLLLLQLGLSVITTLTYVDTSYRLLSIAGLLLVLLIPFLFTGKKDAFSLLALCSLYFAFIPSFDPTFWDKLCDRSFHIYYSKNVFFYALSVLNNELVILVILLVFLGCALSERLNLHNLILIICGCMSLAGAMFIPSWTNFLIYLASYFFIVTAYYLFEKHKVKESSRYGQLLLIILLLFLYLRSIYIMLSILNPYFIK